MAAAAPDNKKKPKSEFEKACDELKEASNDEKEQKQYDAIRRTTASWPNHKNPNKGCVAGNRIVKPHHCSNTIREKLVAFVPNSCPLHYCCFNQGDNCCPGFNLSAFQSIFSISLAALFAIAVDCGDQKSAAAILKHVIGIKQFDFSMTAQCRGTAQEFWIKMIGEAAFVKATGTSQRTDCMTFAPLVAIKLVNDGLMVLKATKGLLGVGFCNLIGDPKRKTKRKKRIEGHAMIMIRNDNIEDIEVVFYAKNGVAVSDFALSFKSNNLRKSGYDNPLVLCAQTSAVQMPPIVPPVTHYSNQNGDGVSGYSGNTVISRQLLGYPMIPFANSTGTYSYQSHRARYQSQRARYSPY